MTTIITFHIDKSIRNKIKKNFLTNFDEEFATNLENEVYNKTKLYVMDNDIESDIHNATYEQFARDILTNLNDKNTISNNKFEQNIKKFKIKPIDVVSMSPHEMQPKTWELVLNRSKKAQEKIKNAGIIDRYTCPKCGGKRFREELKQTRSADEPATQFISCVDCPYKKQF